MNEEDLYNIAKDELNSRNRKPELWARACALATDDVDEARYLYTNLRVDELARENNVNLDAVQAEPVELSMLDTVDLTASRAQQNETHGATQHENSLTLDTDKLDGKAVADENQQTQRLFAGNMRLENPGEAAGPESNGLSPEELFFADSTQSDTEAATIREEPLDLPDASSALTSDNLSNDPDDQSLAGAPDDTDIEGLTPAQQALKRLQSGGMPADAIDSEPDVNEAEAEVESVEAEENQPSKEDVIASKRFDDAITTLEESGPSNDNTVHLDPAEQESIVSATLEDSTNDPGNDHSSIATDESSEISGDDPEKDPDFDTASVNATGTMADTAAPDATGYETSDLTNEPATEQFQTATFSENAAAAGTLAAGAVAAGSVAASAGDRSEHSDIEVGSGERLYGIYQHSNGNQRALKRGNNWLAMFLTLPWLFYRGLFGTAIVYTLLWLALLSAVVLIGIHYLDYNGFASMPMLVGSVLIAALAIIGLLLLPLRYANRWLASKLERKGFDLQFETFASNSKMALLQEDMMDVEFEDAGTQQYSELTQTSTQRY